MEETYFTKALGNSPVVRVLDFLIDGRGLDYSLTDIAENANIGWTTLHRIWDNLVKSSIVMQTREIGNAKLFRLNLSNSAVKKLVAFYDALLIQESNKIAIEVRH